MSKAWFTRKNYQQVAVRKGPIDLDHVDDDDDDDVLDVGTTSLQNATEDDVDMISDTGMWSRSTDVTNNTSSCSAQSKSGFEPFSDADDDFGSFAAQRSASFGSGELSKHRASQTNTSGQSGSQLKNTTADPFDSFASFPMPSSSAPNAVARPGSSSAVVDRTSSPRMRFSDVMDAGRTSSSSPAFASFERDRSDSMPTLPSHSHQTNSDRRSSGSLSNSVLSTINNTTSAARRSTKAMANTVFRAANDKWYEYTQKQQDLEEEERALREDRIAEVSERAHLLVPTAPRSNDDESDALIAL